MCAYNMCVCIYLSWNILAGLQLLRVTLGPGSGQHRPAQSNACAAAPDTSRHGWNFSDQQFNTRVINCFTPKTYKTLLKIP